MFKFIPPAIVALVLSAPVFAQDSETALPPVQSEETIGESALLTAMNDVQTYMQTVKSLKAGFVQRQPDGGMLTGTLFMERPGKVRFEYGDDIPFLVVADGKTLAFIDYEIGQITRWPVSDTPLRVLLGDGLDLASIGARINVEDMGDHDLIMLMAADPDKPEMGHITVYFHRTKDAARTLSLKSWAVVDAQDALTFVEVVDGETNIALESGVWDYEDPRASARRRRVR